MRRGLIVLFGLSLGFASPLASPAVPAEGTAECLTCHDDITLNKKYHLPTKRLISYLGSYHGVALSLGDLRVANCASCHGWHLILPSSDPRSRINPDNLQRTCGQCHPQAGRNFARVKIHIVSPREESPVMVGDKVVPYHSYRRHDALLRKPHNHRLHRAQAPRAKGEGMRSPIFTAAMSARSLLLTDHLPRKEAR